MRQVEQPLHLNSRYDGDILAEVIVPTFERRNRKAWKTPGQIRWIEVQLQRCYASFVLITADPFSQLDVADRCPDIAWNSGLFLVRLKELTTGVAARSQDMQPFSVISGFLKISSPLGTLGLRLVTME